MIDEIVVIKLPHRTDRRSRMEAQMRSADINFVFADGILVDIAEVREEEMGRMDMCNNTRSHDDHSYIAGSVGCARAHAAVLRQALMSKMTGALLIVEDDCCFVTNWWKQLAAAMQKLPGNWIQLYLSVFERNAAKHEQDSCLRQVRSGLHTTAIVYNRATLAFCLNVIETSGCEVDVAFARHLHPLGRCFCVKPMLSYQSGGYSDVKHVGVGRTY